MILPEKGHLFHSRFHEKSQHWRNRNRGMRSSWRILSLNLPRWGQRRCHAATRVLLLWPGNLERTKTSLRPTSATSTPKTQKMGSIQKPRAPRLTKMWWMVNCHHNAHLSISWKPFLQTLGSLQIQADFVKEFATQTYLLSFYMNILIRRSWSQSGWGDSGKVTFLFNWWPIC